jgi:adenylate cyclase
MIATRRLAAILAADVAGYSRLMGADEEGTHERLKAHLSELVEPKIGEHRGRIVKNTGDGLLAEFASVVDAVRCAVEVQRGMVDREPMVTDELRIRFRIGVNLGDVIVEEDDIFGDGVNVAARLETLAEPGGICISRTVRDHIRDKLAYPFEDRGEQSVKNIARPVRVYALGPEAVADLPASMAPPAASTSQTAVAPRLSIVVLPFANLSNDPEQQYFADGMTEDLTTDLSRIADMFVISRNTAFTYKDKRIDTKQIGRELGVRYVLEGSVRRSGNKIRVNAQLIDAGTDAHLWAERFDGDTGDLFALQEEITSRIAIALNVELSTREAARPSDNPDALDYILRGRAAYWKTGLQSRDSFAETLGLYERALALDPHSVEAMSQLANMLAVRGGNRWTDSPAADMRRAEELAGQALMAAPRYWFAHYAKGTVLRFQSRCEEAIPEYEAALASNPNWLNSLHFLAACKMMTGSMEDAISLEQQAIRLGPRDPYIGNFYLRIGQAHLLLAHSDEAIVWFEKAAGAIPGFGGPHAWLASAYALKGETERGASELKEARRLSSRYSSIARLRAAGTLGGPGYWGVTNVRALFEATYFAGLRKAGMPEE